VVREGKSGKIEEAVSLTTMELVRQRYWPKRK